MDCTIRSAASSSTAPVDSLALTVEASRATTLPDTVITLSVRTDSAALKTGLDTSTTTWVTP